MKKSIVLFLSDEELFELERIMLDNNNADALKFLKKHLKREVRAAFQMKATESPGLNSPGRSYIPDEFGK